MTNRNQRLPAGAIPFTTGDKFQYLQRRSAQSASEWNVACALRLQGAVPSAADLHTVMADAAERIPALGYRIGGHGRHRYFEPCPDLDVRDHIEEVRYPRGRAARACLLDAVDRPWPAERTPWSVQIVSGYADGEYLVVYRVAHLLQDGMATAMTAQALLSGQRLPVPVRQPRTHRDWPGLRDVAAGLSYLPEFFKPAAQWVPGRSRPDRNDGWVQHVCTLDRALFDDITRCTKARTAQISLAVLSGALRAWAPEHWEGSGRLRRHGLPVHLTLSLRDLRERHGLGNYVGLIPLTLPCGEPSPAERLQHLMGDADYSRLVRFRRLLMHLHHQRGLIGWTIASIIKACELPRLRVTIVPAESDPAAYGAREVLGVLPREARATAGVLVTPHRSTVTVQVCTRASISTADRLPDLITASLAELHEAVTRRCHDSAPAAPPAPRDSAADTTSVVDRSAS
ncbi:wax ester/triacylglycerol synthase domain-containing protein [Streptomyces sp. NPDC057837]|uniref:wax ester/triacylglycerol synthase domain-containing protein n=1 Tax=Streptomyces sp. NPDC057837 TaxID=3346260 RepID=UPI0036A2716D